MNYEFHQEILEDFLRESLQNVPAKILPGVLAGISIGVLSVIISYWCKRKSRSRE